MDLVVDTAKVSFVDIGPWSSTETSPILFTWDELTKLSDSPLNEWPLKVIESEQDCHLSIYKTRFGPVELENMDSFEIGDEFQFMNHKI